MSRDEIKSKLSVCTNLIELIGEANRLKQAGEKETVVNRVVTELRKELLMAGKRVKHIPRVEVQPTDIQVMGRIPFQVNDLKNPSILYDGESILI